MIKRLLFVILAAAAGLTTAQDDDVLSSSTFSGLKFRGIGPALTSGRISHFAVNPDNPYEYYAAIASGNVWKTTNSGTTWEPVFDNEGSYSIGCVAMDPKNHNVVWIGTGENNSQRSVGYGDGVYKSVDGGKSWKHVGLQESEHVARIVIDPRNSDVVYVAAQGPLWSAGGDRGLYKTTDGGENWELILEISENTGVTDLVYDPRNPDVLYAAAYQRRRHVFTLINGGPESAIYKSTDAGKNWRKLTNGIPGVDLGRIGLAISPVNPDYVYAIVEAAQNKSGFFRSTDRGETWKKMSSYEVTSPQYYSEIYCDPADVDKVYSLDTRTKITYDGGKNFENLPRSHRHVDDHALWIDPDNTSHILIGGDGGIYESFDNAATWNFKRNLPVTQYYKVSLDNSEPFYYIYGGTQDNNSMGGPSRTTSASGIVNSDWFITNGGDGFETQVDPEDPNILYSQSQYGWLVRFDKRSGEKIGIKPQEGKGEDPYRWNWDSPLIISPHSHTRLYFAANVLFRSDDRGNSWTKISGDLTRELDRNQLKVMGEIQSIDAPSKNASTSLYGNIVALAESPVKEGLIYCGTDDGLIQVTENGGESWREISTFPGVPSRTYVRYIIASNFDANTVFAAFDNHKEGDFKPYLLKSTDAGRSWTSIASNLPDRGSVYSIAQDHIKPELMFAGTEFTVFFTLDGGKKWIELKSGVPTISVRDMEIQKREDDLVLGTFGRGFFVLDDYSPLREIGANTLDQDAVIFPVKDALMYIERYPFGGSGKASQGDAFYAAPNPPFGATFTYYLKESLTTLEQDRRKREKELKKEGGTLEYPTIDQMRAEDLEEKPYLVFTIKDQFGNIVRKLEASASKGINRITWDLRYHPTYPIHVKDEFNPFADDPSGMLAMPGEYTVEMAKVEDGIVTPLTGPVKFNTRVLSNTTLPAEDRQALVDFQNKVADLSGAVQGARETLQFMYEKIESIKKAIMNTPGLDADLMTKAENVEADLHEIKRKLVGDETLQKRNMNTPPSISGRVSTIIYEQWRTTSAPTETQKNSYQIAAEEFAPVLSKMETLMNVDFSELEKALDDAGAPWTPGRMPKWKMK